MTILLRERSGETLRVTGVPPAMVAELRAMLPADLTLIELPDETGGHYRANFGDGTYTKAYADIRDAKREIWARAGIVQYRSYIEQEVATGEWAIVQPSRAQRNGPPIVAESTADDDPRVRPAGYFGLAVALARKTWGG